MKHLVLLLTLIISAEAWAQDTIMLFTSAEIDINLRGKTTEKSLPNPIKITVDLGANTININTDESQVKELFRNKMTQPINSIMGELGDEFSLGVAANTFAHFYLDDRKMILFTRNDIHPLKWGLMLKDVKFVETGD